MTAEKAKQILIDTKVYYDSISLPKYRNADLVTLKEKFNLLQSLKDDLGHDKAYKDLINAMSQVISKIEKKYMDQKWTNLSERGTNKVIPFITKSKDQSWPVEYNDRYGNPCQVSNGYWGIKNSIVMDVIGNLFVLKEGGDRLPKNAEPLFNDLFEIQTLENQLNGVGGPILNTGKKHYVRFTDDDFRKCSGLKMNSTEIKKLLLETSRVEFMLTFPVRLKSPASKENIHRMNYYSRFFEFATEEISVKSNGIVLSRRYTIVFNTLLGELFVNNLFAKFNDRLDNHFYHLPDSAQIFYRKELINNNFPSIPIMLTTIADRAGLTDKNPWNLIKTVETNILQPLKESGYIDSFDKTIDDPTNPKYIIKRSCANNNEISRDVVGSVKDVVGSVKDVVGSVKNEKAITKRNSK